MTPAPWAPRIRTRAPRKLKKRVQRSWCLLDFDDSSVTWLFMCWDDVGPTAWVEGAP